MAAHAHQAIKCLSSSVRFFLPRRTTFPTSFQEAKMCIDLLAAPNCKRFLLSRQLNQSTHDSSIESLACLFYRVSFVDKF